VSPLYAGYDRHRANAMTPKSICWQAEHDWPRNFKASVFSVRGHHRVVNVVGIRARSRAVLLQHRRRVLAAQRHLVKNIYAGHKLSSDSRSSSVPTSLGERLLSGRQIPTAVGFRHCPGADRSRRDWSWGFRLGGLPTIDCDSVELFFLPYAISFFLTLDTELSPR
jgi:hypothetical protein